MRTLPGGGGVEHRWEAMILSAASQRIEANLGAKCARETNDGAKICFARRGRNGAVASTASAGLRATARVEATRLVVRWRVKSSDDVVVVVVVVLWCCSRRPGTRPVWIGSTVSNKMQQDASDAGEGTIENLHGVPGNRTEVAGGIAI